MFKPEENVQENNLEANNYNQGIIQHKIIKALAVLIVVHCFHSFTCTYFYLNRRQ